MAPGAGNGGRTATCYFVSEWGAVVTTRGGIFATRVKNNGTGKALTCFQFIGTEAALYLSEVELEDVADVVRRVIRQLHQVLPVFECLAELLHARFGAVHTINSLQGPREKTKKTNNKQTNHEQFLVEVNLPDGNSTARLCGRGLP